MTQPRALTRASVPYVLIPIPLYERCTICGIAINWLNSNRAKVNQLTPGTPTRRVDD